MLADLPGSSSLVRYQF